MKDQHGYVMRVGDGDPYTVKDNLQGVSEQLAESGVQRLDGRTPLGVTADGFHDQNYISLFVGVHNDRDGSTPERGITDEEFDEINELLNAH